MRRNKIIYIANVRLPTEKAHGDQIMKMCDVFLGEEMDLELIIPDRRNEIYQNINLNEYYKVKNSFKIKKIKIFDPIFLFGWAESMYIKVESLLFIVSLSFYLLFYQQKDNCIFYTRDEYLLPFLRFFSKKVVWEAHAIPGKKRYYAKFFNGCLAIIALTEQLKKDLVDLGIAADKILVCPDAVDLKIFDLELDQISARGITGLPQNNIILGYTGSFKTKAMDKGLNDIFGALEIIFKKESRDIIFVAVGGNDADKKYYQEIVQMKKLTAQVRLLGKVDQNKLAVYQKAFDILLMPFPDIAHYAYYMSPLKMFEYMASRRPIISSDLPSVREVLNENNCLFCQAGQPEDLAEKIIYLVNRRELGERIAGRAYLDIKKYTWEKRADNILNFITLCLSR